MKIDIFDWDCMKKKSEKNKQLKYWLFETITIILYIAVFNLLPSINFFSLLGYAIFIFILDPFCIWLGYYNSQFKIYSRISFMIFLIQITIIAIILNISISQKNYVPMVICFLIFIFADPINKKRIIKW